MSQLSDQERYVASIRADADRISATARTGSLDASVPSCPGWTLRDLVKHTAFVHRWATHALVHGEAPPEGAVVEWTAEDNLAVFIVEGAAGLIAAIEATSPDGDTWHPFPLEQKNWVWARRQALETSIHRWDAEVAVNGTSSLDPVLASEGIHEYLELGLPRVLSREKLDPPTASLHVHCTDVDGEWLIWGDQGSYRMLPVHDKGDAALRGTAEALLLVLMGRTSSDSVEAVGDESAATAWLDLPGW